MMERGGMMVFNKLFGKFKKAEVEDEEEIKVQDYLDMIAPSTIRFYTEYFICGNSYRSVWALREYPTSTDEQALLRYMGEKDGVTLHIMPDRSLLQRKRRSLEMQLIKTGSDKAIRKI